MFVPVSCTSCGKPFQVPEAALGKFAPCPWCQAVVTALPVSAPIAEPQPQQHPQQQAQPQSQTRPAPVQKPPEPLSLDDAPAAQIPVAQKAPEPRVTGQPEATRPATPPDTTAPAAPLAPAWREYLLPGAIGLALLVVVTAATLLLLNYGSGRLSDAGWSEFTPADGSFTVLLPGKPEEEEVAANPNGSVTGGKRFTVRGWYSKTAAWVSYCDLDPALVKKLPADRDRVLAAGVLHAEREREKARLEGTVTNEVAYRLLSGWGIELHLDTPRGKVVEWLVVVGEGNHPRVYAFGVEGKDVTPTNPAASRLRGSFRPND